MGVIIFADFDFLATFGRKMTVAAARNTFRLGSRGAQNPTKQLATWGNFCFNHYLEHVFLEILALNIPPSIS